MAVSTLRLVNPSEDDSDSGSPLDEFHHVNKVLPEDQEILSIAPDTSVREALDLMDEHGYSQLPVKTGDHVLGCFSYRSFACGCTDVLGEPNVNAKDLTVLDFVESHEFARLNEELPNTFSALDSDNAVLIDNDQNLVGVLTPLDVLRYLYEIAGPFVVIAEIELTLRKIIMGCCTSDQLESCIDNALGQKRDDGHLPSSLEEMTFNDYVQIIGDGRNWEHFAFVFGGAADYQRKRTRGRLKEIRDLRNDIFHFKRRITPEDRSNLFDHRTWLWQRAVHMNERDTDGA